MEWLTWLMLLPVGMGGLLSLLFFYQHRLIYFPDVPAGFRTKMLDPRDSGLSEPEAHMLRMSDGVHVHVWVFAHETNARSRPTVVFLHGNAGNMSFRNDNFRALFHRCRANVVAVEYRGFGLSEGSPSDEARLRADAAEVLEWVAQRSDVDAERLFVLGRSIGGAVGIHVAAARPRLLAGMIVENTFTSVSELVDAVMPHLSYFKFLLRHPWNNIALAPRLHLPALFIQSGRDELIPRHHMPALERSWGGRAKHSFFAPDAGHMTANAAPGYDERIAEFIWKFRRADDAGNVLVNGGGAE